LIAAKGLNLPNRFEIEEEALKLDGFDNKYSFIINSSNPDVLRVINKDLVDGRRNAINSLAEPNTGFGSFFNFKKK